MRSAESSHGFPAWPWKRNWPRPRGARRPAGLTDRQALHTVLSQRQNRYLARQLCYVLTIEGLETYLLQPRDPGDFELLVDAIRPAPRPTDVDVVIGVRGPIAPPELCNGLMIPIVAFDQIYSFDIDALIAGIPRPEQIPAEQFAPAAEELFMRLMQMADNAGATDEHRALNYLTVRYPAIYAITAERHAQNASLTAVEVPPVAPQRGAQHCRCHLLLYPSPDGRHREVFRPRGCDRGVPVPGHPTVTLLRPVNQTSHMPPHDGREDAMTHRKLPR